MEVYRTDSRLPVLCRHAPVLEWVALAFFRQQGLVIDAGVAFRVASVLQTLGNGFAGHLGRMVS